MSVVATMPLTTETILVFLRSAIVVGFRRVLKAGHRRNSAPQEMQVPSGCFLARYYYMMELLLLQLVSCHFCFFCCRPHVLLLVATKHIVKSAFPHLTALLEPNHVYRLHHFLFLFADLNNRTYKRIKKEFLFSF